MDEQVEIILRGGQFMKLLDEHLRELRQKYDMKRVELEILYFLSKCGENNTSTDIHHQLAMNRGHISQAVDSLCKKHYLVAIPDQNDRRYVHYELTDIAKETVLDISRQHEKMIKEILKGITDEEMQAFKKVAVKIWKNMNALL